MGKFFNQIAAIIGNVLEHKDKALFTLLTPFIAPQFFPSDDYVASLLQMYGVILVSLLVRPIGSILFGRMADSGGRKKALLISMYGMSFATIGMGLLPTYETFGYFASICLFFLRASQNFFGSAEPTNGAIYVLEHSHQKWRPFVSSLFEASTMLGILLASFETAVFAYFGWLESYWQVLFLISGGLGFICMIYRKQFAESPEFKPQVLKVKDLKNYTFPLLSVACATGFSYATYMFSMTVINGYLKATTSLTSVELTSINTFLSVFDLLALPFFGYMALLIAPVTLMTAAAGLMAVLAIPLFMWMESSPSVFVILSARVIIVTAGVCFVAPFRAWMQDLVSAKERGLVLNTGSAIGQVFSETLMTSFVMAAIHQRLWMLPATAFAIFGISTAFIVWRSRSRLRVCLPSSVE